MKVRITVRPVGYIAIGGEPLTAWPPAGEVVDLPDDIAEDLIKGGNAEKVPGWSGREWLWPWRRPRVEAFGPTEMKVRIKVQPRGYLALGEGPLRAWPPAGTVVELPNDIAEDLIKGGFAEVFVADEVSVKTVQVKVTRAWPKVGSVIDVPAEFAAGLVAGGFATEVLQGPEFVTGEHVGA